tara:strand:- start:20 stop:214 length:195 start_codon:yes stop_codon:yes gene_type:complete
MTEFVSIPASMFWVMVGFIVVLLAFNAYFIHKWDIAIQELERLEKNYNRDISPNYTKVWSKIDI